MKNIKDILFPSVYAVGEVAACNQNADGYSDCCIGKLSNISSLELGLNIALDDGDQAQITQLRSQIMDAEIAYRTECPTYSNVTPVGEVECQKLYGDFFVTAGEAEFADMCMCDDRTTSNVELIDCKTIAQTSFQKYCTDQGGVLKGGVCDICAFGLATDGTCVANTQGTLGIECGDPTKPCSLNTAELFRSTGVASGTESKSLLVRFQDITLAATGFIGTVLTVGFIVVALRYIMGGADESYVGNAKRGLTYGIIGFFLVAFSYTIIRVVQFLAKGG